LSYLLDAYLTWSISYWLLWWCRYVRYWKDAWNVLDGLIVFISIIDLILAAVLSGKGGGSLQVSNPATPLPKT
jgi:hypothetical protein